MSSKTKRLNGAVSRYAFWEKLSAKLAEFDALMKHREHFTPADVKVQREIHEALYRCYEQSKEMRRRQEGLMKEVIEDGSEVVNQSREC